MALVSTFGKRKTDTATGERKCSTIFVSMEPIDIVMKPDEDSEFPPNWSDSWDDRLSIRKSSKRCSEHHHVKLRRKR